MKFVRICTKILLKTYYALVIDDSFCLLWFCLSVFNLVSDLQQGIQSKYVKKVFKKCPIKAYNKCVSFHFMGEWLVTWNKFSGLSEITSNLLISIDTNSHGMTLTNFYTDGHNGWIKLEWGYPKTPKGTPIARLGGSDTSRNINFI